MRFLFLLAIATGAHACSCAGEWPSVKQAWAESPSVFLGTVELADPDKPGREVNFQEQYVRIRVDEAFKGVFAGQMIELHEGGGDCSAKFRTGDRAVFYLYGGPGAWDVPPCAHSLGGAAPAGDDLLFLHGLPKSAKGTRLSGEVELYEDSAQESFKRVGGVPNVPVAISGPNGSKVQTRTNPDGAYELYDLSPGKYEISVAVPSGLRSKLSTVEGEPRRPKTPLDLASRSETTVELAENGGVSVSFVLEADTRISGHMLDANGSPKKDVCIDLEPLEGRGENGAYFFDCSKEGGSFHMEMMPPGKYWLIARDEVKSDQFKSKSTLYYPGMRDRNNARTISVEAGKYLENLDIKLPSGEKRYQIMGRMEFQDGAPVSGGVTFTSPRHGYTETSETAKDGSFALPVIAGMEGELNGRMVLLAPMLASCPELKVGPQIRGALRFIDATPVSIAGVSDHTDLKLILPSPSCKALLPHGN